MKRLAIQDVILTQEQCRHLINIVAITLHKMTA
jgi:hypothetical protein